MADEFEFGACEMNTMQAASSEYNIAFVRVRAMLTSFIVTTTDSMRRFVRDMPGCCKLAMSALMLAGMVATLLGPVWAFLASIMVTLAIWHGVIKSTRDRSISPKAENVEQFYQTAPHNMIVTDNPVFAHDEGHLTGRAEETPWDADEDEIADGVRELRQFTPPELLEAVQTNEVPSTPMAPGNFAELGERLG
jgi:hypothetical protein